MKDPPDARVTRTVRWLEASLPEPGPQGPPPGTLLRLAAEELTPLWLLGMLAGTLLLVRLVSRLVPDSMTLMFWTAPLPTLLLFHRQVLQCNAPMRELESTFLYSYEEMLCARTLIISLLSAAVLPPLALLLREPSGEALIRLLLCGAVPDLYLSALLLFIAGRVRSPDTLSMAGTVCWAGLGYASLVLNLDATLRLCSTGLYAALVAAGLLLLALCFHQTRRECRSGAAGAH